MIALRTLLFTFLVPGTTTVLIPYLLLSSGAGGAVALGPLRFFGLPPLLLGVAGGVWCVWDFAVAGRGTPAPYDPPKELVVTGLYRFVRNPIYISGELILLGEAILFQAPILLLYAGLILFGFHLFVLYYEEPTLGRLFGESYMRYCAVVPRWIPRLPRK